MYEKKYRDNFSFFRYEDNYKNYFSNIQFETYKALKL